MSANALPIPASASRLVRAFRLAIAGLVRSERAPAFRAAPDNESRRERLRQRAGHVLRARTARASFLPKDMFAEEAWEIMLRLFAGGNSGDAPDGFATVERNSTTWRWTMFLSSVGLVSLQMLGEDSQSALICLTSKGEAAIIAYLNAITVSA